MGAKDWFCLFVVFNTAFSSTDSACATSRGLVGTCVPQSQCAPLKKILKQSSFTSYKLSVFLSEWRCTPLGYTVCCPNDEVYTEKPPSVEEHHNLNLLPGSTECATFSSNKIYGGMITNPLEYTWMALIATDIPNIGRDFTCGGSIINSRYILTAAHCIIKLQGAILAGVRLGEHDISTDQDCQDCPAVQDIGIEEIIPHPRYIGQLAGKQTDLNYDIGLLRLSDPIDLTAVNTKPVCLPTTKYLRELALENSNLTVSGWGRTNIGDDGDILHFEKENSNELLAVKLPVVSNKICANVYNNSGTGGIGFRHICAGGQSGFSSCSGDSGGPAGQALVIGKKVHFVQYGIVSAGGKCGSEGQPSIFTNVVYYMDWILDQLKP